MGGFDYVYKKGLLKYASTYTFALHQMQVCFDEEMAPGKFMNGRRNHRK
jgi:hypothetical protein